MWARRLKNILCYQIFTTKMMIAVFHFAFVLIAQTQSAALPESEAGPIETVVSTFNC